MMGDRKALQAGTSHFLGQNFARAFDISFQNKNGEMDFAWTTSWGVSTRLIGAIIMTHSDDDGLVLPPRIAPVKAAVIPISNDESKLQDVLAPMAQGIARELNESSGVSGVSGGMCAQVDRQYHMRPADRFFHHLQRGVPVRIELGEREHDARRVTVVRRDTAQKEQVSLDALTDYVKTLLSDIQNDLYAKARAFRDDNTHDVSSMAELKEFFSKDSRGGFARAYFAGSSDDERDIKDMTGGATIRCMPSDDETRGKCVYTGAPGARRAVFAKAY
jgi:prolyl-tRNA synthetase